MKKWLWEMIYCFWMKSCLMPTQRQEILQHFTTHFKGFQRLNQRDDSKCIRYSNTHHLDTGNIFQEKSYEKSQIPLLKQSVMDVSIFLRWEQCKELQEQIEVQSMWRQLSNQPSQLWSKSKSSQENCGPYVEKKDG